MRITITGASGLIGSRLVKQLEQRGDEVTKLSRKTNWDPGKGPAPAELLAGRDAIVHLAGENVAQRWTDESRKAIRDSRELGTRNLVEGISQADPKPKALISSSAVGYYGPHGDEKLDEDTPPGTDFLAEVCVAWEREADKAAELGLRVVKVRTGVVLDAERRRALEDDAAVQARRRRPRRRRQAVHAVDPRRRRRRHLPRRDRRQRLDGAVNASAPEPVTNKTFSKALGRALHRPAIAPIPGAAIRLLYGDMAEIVTKGQRVVPRRTLELGYQLPAPRSRRSAAGRGRR